MSNFDISVFDHGLKFAFNFEASRYFEVLIPRELLDDEVGDNRTEAQSMSWVEENLDEIIGAAKNRIGGGGTYRIPFNRILVREIT